MLRRQYIHSIQLIMYMNNVFCSVGSVFLELLSHFKYRCLFVRLALVHPTVHNVFVLLFSTRDWLD